jgi:hypothetical protein
VDLGASCIGNIPLHCTLLKTAKQHVGSTFKGGPTLCERVFGEAGFEAYSIRNVSGAVLGLSKHFMPSRPLRQALLIGKLLIVYSE